jgi:hypothetical protein
MRFRTRATIMAAFAGPAIAAMLLTGAGPANAAVTTTGHTATSSSFPGFPFCFRRHLERWDFNGDNTVVATLNGSTMIFKYPVDFRQRGSCLRGTLTDPYFNPPTGISGPISGIVVRNRVTFSFTYPAGSVQGTRTFVGRVNFDGDVSGTWSETGSANETGTWSLADQVQRACPDFFPWFGFFEFGAGCPVPFPFFFF